jgi:NitT/TauT family transport system substrate-binding protein
LRSIRVCVALLIALLTAGPLTVEGTTAQAPGEPIVVAGLPNDSSAEMYYAADKGFYQKAGLNVKLLTLPAGAISSAVISGTAAIGTLTVPAVALAREKKIPLVIIAPASMYSSASPTSGLIVLKDSPYRKAADLNGKVVATRDLANLSYYGALAWIDKNGGDAKSVKFIEVPNSAAAAALVDHRVDGTCLNEPQLSAAVGSGKVRILAPAYSAIAEHFVFTVYFAQPSWATAHKDAIAKFQRVTYDAAKYTNAHHPETVALMSQVTKIPERTIAKMARTPHATSGDPALIQVAIDAAAKYGFIEKRFTAKDAYFSG